jgi:hypothetical protein
MGENLHKGAAFSLTSVLFKHAGRQSGSGKTRAKTETGNRRVIWTATDIGVVIEVSA